MFFSKEYQKSKSDPNCEDNSGKKEIDTVLDTVLAPVFITQNLANSKQTELILTMNNDKNKIDDFDTFYLVRCPHCEISIQIMKNQTRCNKFICGQHKSNGAPMKPHASKSTCKIGRAHV